MTGKRSLITVDDIVGAFAIIPTPAKPGSSDWRMEDTVDYDEAARVVERLIAAGVDGIISLGTFGECASLTWDEKYKFMATIIDAAAGRVPVFVGTTALNTRETIRQTRAAADLGANGTMLGLPMWCAPSIPTAVQYYKDVAEACPDMGICVYANRQAFKFEFATSFWAQLQGIDQIVCSKHPGIDGLLRDTGVTRKRIRFMPIDMDYYGAARMDPDFYKAFWTSCAVCGPAPTILFRDAIIQAKQTGDWSRAQQLSMEIGMTQMPLFPNGSFVDFSTYNIILEKEKMNAAGWMVAGPTRPPYQLAPAPYLDGAREAGRRSIELHKKYEHELKQAVVA